MRAAVNKKTFSRAHKIREHLKVARATRRGVAAAGGRAGKWRTRQVAARRRAARERVERLEEALVEVERLQAEKKWEKEKPCQASTTDPDAQFMRTSDHGLAPSYNVQLTTDTAYKLIVDVEVSKQPSDSLHLLPALERVRRTVRNLSATSGGRRQLHDAGSSRGRRSTRCGLLRKLGGDPGGEQVGKHGIHPDYRPNAFQYDEQCDEMICPEGRRLKPVTHAATGRWAADQNLRSQSRRLLVLPETAALLAPERDAKTRADGKPEN